MPAIVTRLWAAFEEHPWAGAVIVFLAVIALVAVGGVLCRTFWG